MPKYDVSDSITPLLIARDLLNMFLSELLEITLKESKRSSYSSINNLSYETLECSDIIKFLMPILLK